uniref:Uncharacterized protein n=1 Tax=Anguilla anguilla TaxID=7936 RepID=A0A0E9V3Q8_ANGAN
MQCNVMYCFSSR